MTEELFREDSYLQNCTAIVTAVSDQGVVLDRTVFYPSGGGQPGDRGLMTFLSGEASIVDTRKDENGILHVLEENATVPSVGEEVTVNLDWDRRHILMRMHTCMHLVCSLVEGDVTGGQVGEAKSRLDFNIPENPDKVALGEALNKLIVEDHPLTHSWITDEELDANPDLVRTMSVQPPRGSGRIRMIKIADVDLQPCGGTHVKSTAEIGRVRIGKIENKGKQNRRINILFDEEV
ncbi:MAG: Ala-tRNA(Pro) hydrolase [Rhodospirillaceae bacterium]|nr:MAG: Ala-tRNA(Pro) hydrolase [Rhodospirillaceae bacterium]